MSKILGLGLLILGTVAAGWGLWPKNEQATIEPKPEKIVNEEPVKANPYSIDSLKARSYASELKTERKVRETSGLTSYVVSFESDGLKQYALMNVPRGDTPAGGWPVVIVNHGYIEPEVFSTENSYINTSAYFANAGFLVLKPDYRGHDKSEGEPGRLVSRINYAVDVLNMMAGIPRLEGANAERIYMYGHSMGGDVTLRVLEVCDMCVKAATLWAPAVTAWPESALYFARRNSTDPKRRERLARFEQELKELFRPEEYKGVSAFDNLELVRVPLNVHHGTQDQSVPYEWGEILVNRFKELGLGYNFYSYSGDNHDIAGNWGRALARDVELFNKFP